MIKNPSNDGFFCGTSGGARPSSLPMAGILMRLCRIGEGAISAAHCHHQVRYAAAPHGTRGRCPRRVSPALRAVASDFSLRGQRKVTKRKATPRQVVRYADSLGSLIGSVVPPHTARSCAACGCAVLPDGATDPLNSPRRLAGGGNTVPDNDQGGFCESVGRSLRAVGVPISPKAVFIKPIGELS